MQCYLVDYSDPAQADDLVHLLNLYAQDPMGGDKSLTDHVQQNLVSELASRSFAFSIIGYLNGKPVALANCFEGFSTFACQPLTNIHDFMVVKELRGKGLSQTLMHAVCEEAVKRGCCKITLEVLDGNKAAISAYRAYGFRDYQLDPDAGTARFMELSLS